MTDTVNEVTIDLVPLFKKAFRHKAILALAFGLFLVLGLIIGLALTPEYTIQFVIAPKSEVPGTGSSSSAGGSFDSSSAASLLGSLSGGTTSAPPTDFAQYRKLLVSHASAEIIVAHPEMMHRLIPGWNEETKTWTRPSNPIFWLRQGAKMLLGRPLWTPPGTEEVYQALQKKLDFEDDLSGSFVDGTMTDKDPKFAEQFIYFLHGEVQEMVKKSKRADSVARIAYLDQKLQTVTFADQRSVLIALLAQEQQKLMLIEADKDFVAQVIDPPIVPKSPSTLSPSVLALLSAILGTFLAGITLALVSEERLERLREWFRLRRRHLPSWQTR